MSLASRARETITTVRARVRAILSANLTPEGIGWAVGLGVFVGALPIYGVHIGVCLVLARWLKLNYAVLYGAANISNPVFAPFLIAAEIWVGQYLRYGTTEGVDLSAFSESFVDALTAAPDVFYSCMYGSVVLGVVLGVPLGLLSWGIARWRQA